MYDVESIALLQFDYGLLHSRKIWQGVKNKFGGLLSNRQNFAQ